MKLERHFLAHVNEGSEDNSWHMAHVNITVDLWLGRQFSVHVNITVGRWLGRHFLAHVNITDGWKLGRHFLSHVNTT